MFSHKIERFNFYEYYRHKDVYNRLEECKNVHTSRNVSSLLVEIVVMFGYACLACMEIIWNDSSKFLVIAGVDSSELTICAPAAKAPRTQSHDHPSSLSGEYHCVLLI